MAGGYSSLLTDVGGWNAVRGHYLRGVLGLRAEVSSLVCSLLQPAELALALCLTRGQVVLSLLKSLGLKIGKAKMSNWASSRLSGTIPAQIVTVSGEANPFFQEHRWDSLGFTWSGKYEECAKWGDRGLEGTSSICSSHKSPFLTQIEDRLPHLKGIVQYGEEIKEKRPNLYSVSPGLLHSF